VPYDNIISRTKVSAMLPEDFAGEIWTRVAAESAAMTRFRRVPASREQTRVPVLSALPTAYFVTGDTGTKQTTEVSWANKFINIEEIACIVPVPEAVLDDSTFDIWGAIRPLLEEAVGRTLDAAVFFGTNAPAGYPTNVNAAAAAAGNNYTEVATAAAGGFADDIDATLALVEADGFDADGIVAARSSKSRLRRTRDTTGQRAADISANGNMYLDLPISYPMRGLFPTGGGAGTNVRLFAGDWSQFALATRGDINVRILDQAVIHDPAAGTILGLIKYNLAQQDMVAMRMTFRAGWQVANIINYDQPTEASRYPVGVLRY
jgi:HK97 family phage major capsid protein